MRALVCGHPDWTDYYIVKVMLDANPPTEVIHNDALTGADAAAAEWCAANGVPEIVVPVDTTKGAEAQSFNIAEMLAQSPDLVFSFTFMDPDNPEAVPQLLATEMAFEAGIAIDFTILDPRPAVDEDDPSLYQTCSLCGLTIKQAIIGEENPHWSDLNGDLVCTASTEARPDHVPIQTP